MKFGTNFAFTIRNKKKIEKERERHNFGHNHRDSEKHDYHGCMKIN